GGVRAEAEPMRRGAAGLRVERGVEVLQRPAEGAVGGAAHPALGGAVPAAALLGEAPPPVELEEVGERALLVRERAGGVEREDLPGERGAAAVGHAEGPLLGEIALVLPEAGFEVARVVRAGGDAGVRVNGIAPRRLRERSRTEQEEADGKNAAHTA